jgi:GT2 family glycosyltransferase
MNKIDVIILSQGISEELIALTNETVRSLFESEQHTDIEFEVLIIESNPNLEPYQYPRSKTIYPKTKFGFHKYLNIGLSITSNDLVCFCNNDLIFHEGWASNIVSAIEADESISSVSMYCPIFHEDKAITDNLTFGYKNGVHFTGWCFMVKRKVFDQVGKFDENFVFWFSDDDFRLTLEKYKLKNVLIKNAKVTHLGSRTLSNEDIGKQTALQLNGFAYYKYKWQHHSMATYLIDSLKYKIKVGMAKIKVQLGRKS